MTHDNIKIPVYLDYHATTPVDPRALEIMLPWFTEKFGNPHSTSHSFGHEAAEAVEMARGQVARMIGADPREIVFTSGATESNNLAIKGAARFERRQRDQRNRIVTLVSEHKCVVESVKDMEQEGFETIFLPVQPNGKVDLAVLDRAIDDKTVLVSVMAANNEIGVIQPLAEIGAMTRDRGVLLHTDAAQAAGKIPLDINDANIDLLSISGHKLYGPNGIGALYVRRRPRARLEPLFSGGGQERTVRSGTLPAPLVIGFGEACALATAELSDEADRLVRLRQRFLDRLGTRVEDFAINGDIDDRLAGNINLRFEGVDALKLIDLAPDLAFSTGSACTSAVVEPSYVLRAIGLTDDEAGSSVRLGLGRFTTADEIDFAADHLATAIRQCRERASAA
ncbi:MAG: IscS subfamily cysteine desulfurase [Rhodospirillaceae bacterium]|nr:IscS subfamily cysteine desulfurase [Rhodospirillaceae bacterium]|tara:strand:+ start:15739 stop:16923 length:1185 start_codon:yes stop_codon:yes gene_type:complete